LQGTLVERAESLVVGVPRSDDAQPERALEAIEHSISVPVFKVDCHPLPPTSFKRKLIMNIKFKRLGKKLVG